MVNKIAITADSVCDLSKKLIKENEIDLIYFDIQLNSGVFKDTLEITEKNILEYVADGNRMAKSVEAKSAEYKKFFLNLLEEYDEIVHICMGSKMGNAVENANLARAQLGIEGQRVFVFDSMQISTGMGMIVLEAVRRKKEGLSGKEIVEELEQYKDKVYTSFIAKNADYLYYNNRVSRNVMLLCQRLNLHPIFHVKDGELKLQNIMIGNYKSAQKLYIKRCLKKSNSINMDRGFLTYVGMPLDSLEEVENLMKEMEVHTISRQSACAAVSANCGPGAFGIIVQKK